MTEEKKFDAFYAFEHYRELSNEDRAQVRAIHKAIRTKTCWRDGNLAWGFVRGFPYRRIERTTRTQTMPDGTVVPHNAPSALRIARILAEAIPGLEQVWFETKYKLRADCPLVAWLANPEGAIAAPAPRPKKPYVRGEGSAA
jgi:hypothetical protein